MFYTCSGYIKLFKGVEDEVCLGWGYQRKTEAEHTYVPATGASAAWFDTPFVLSYCLERISPPHTPLRLLLPSGLLKNARVSAHPLPLIHIVYLITYFNLLFTFFFSAHA